MNISEELDRLGRLLKEGFLTRAEFEQAKARLLQAEAPSPSPLGPPPVAPSLPPPGPPVVVAGTSVVADYTPEARQWAMWLHLSSLAGFLVPMAGLVAPILIWQIKKNDFNVIDAHGKVITNWIISSFIYSVVAIPLCFVIIGFFVILGVLVANIVFAIIGGIKANQGILWRYPLSIPFFK